MKKLYVHNGKAPAFGGVSDANREGKGLERLIEGHVGETQWLMRTSLLSEWDAIAEELKIETGENRKKIEERIEDFLSREITCQKYYLDDFDIEMLFDGILWELFQIELCDEADLDCPDCFYGRAYGNKGPCERCAGTGVLTPEQLEEVTA